MQHFNSTAFSDSFLTCDVFVSKMERSVSFVHSAKQTKRIHFCHSPYSVSCPSHSQSMSLQAPVQSKLRQAL